MISGRLNRMTMAMVMAIGACFWVLGAGSVSAQNVTAERLANSDKEPQNWINHHGNLGAQRFSGLKEINTTNVSKLKMAFTYAIGGAGGGGKELIVFPFSGLEGTPIAENGFLYLTNGWGTVIKIDVHKGVPEFVWAYDPKPDKDYAPTVTCCGINNRGVALSGELVFDAVIDGRMVALNKKDGSVVWERQVADPGVAEVFTGAPLVVKDMVLTGMAGAEFGIRGWVEAMNVSDGKRVWRTYTIPAPGEPGSETWKDGYEAWKTGGGSTWVTGSYDPQMNLVVWGVGNPGPDWDNEYRPGDNLYTDSTIGMDADTGAIKWHFQHTPNDPYDYDSISENTFVDTTIKGKKVKATLHANRNGFAYAVDRGTGEYLWGTAFVKKVTWTPGLDAKGRPANYDPNSDVQRYAAGTSPHRPKVPGVSCPGNMGGKNWPPTAYNPQTNYYYIPVIESCNTMANEIMKPGEWKARGFFLGGGPSQHERITGSLTAIDVSTGKVAGKYETKFPLLGGVLTTAGGLVFTGLAGGEVVALDAKSLKELWRFPTGSGINAPPMSYSVDGKQYIAIEVGLGGAWPQWFDDSTPELKKMRPSNVLYVFSL